MTHTIGLDGNTVYEYMANAFGGVGGEAVCTGGKILDAPNGPGGDLVGIEDADVCVGTLAEQAATLETEE